MEMFKELEMFKHDIEQEYSGKNAAGAKGGCMQRLSDNAIEIVNELHTEKLAYESEYVPIIDALNRLAEYEDTRLEPDEILTWKDLAEAAYAFIFLNEYKSLGTIDHFIHRGCAEVTHWMPMPEPPKED